MTINYKPPFSYIDNQLYFENYNINSLSNTYRTPFYVYSLPQILTNFNQFKNAALKHGIVNHLICYALKANSHSDIIQLLKTQGAGADIVSQGELICALQNGTDSQKIVFSGVGKTEEEIKVALSSNIYSINVESIDELKTINSIAKQNSLRARVAFRLNPQVKTKTHKYISTGYDNHKFGIISKDIDIALQNKDLWSHTDLVGLSIHIGSQLTCLEATSSALYELKELIKNHHINLEFIDVGGGLGIPYNEEEESTIATVDDYMKLIKKCLNKEINENIKIIFEPGRYLVANAGALVTKVIRIKQSENSNFVIVDGGMNDFARTALYEAFHNILPTPYRENSKNILTNIVGPICESSDYFAKNREMPEIKKKDLLIIADAGAYGYSMCSTYNLRSKPIEVILN